MRSWLPNGDEGITKDGFFAEVISHKNDVQSDASPQNKTWMSTSIGDKVSGAKKQACPGEWLVSASGSPALAKQTGGTPGGFINTVLAAWLIFCFFFPSTILTVLRYGLLLQGHGANCCQPGIASIGGVPGFKSGNSNFPPFTQDFSCSMPVLATNGVITKDI